jgi:hypothetical protein
MRDMLKKGKEDENVESIDYNNIEKKMNEPSKFMLPLHFILVNADITLDSPINKDDTWEDVVEKYMDCFIYSLDLYNRFRDYQKKYGHGNLNNLYNNPNELELSKVKSIIDRLIITYKILNEYIIDTNILKQHNSVQNKDFEIIEDKIIKGILVGKKLSTGDEYKKYIDTEDKYHKDITNTLTRYN